MEKPSIHQPFGASSQTESSWEETLSEAYANFILAFVEMEQAREAAVIEQFWQANRL
jgi:hypothetical protein